MTGIQFATIVLLLSVIAIKLDPNEALEITVGSIILVAYDRYKVGRHH